MDDVLIAYWLYYIFLPQSIRKTFSGSFIFVDLIWVIATQKKTSSFVTSFLVPHYVHNAVSNAFLRYFPEKLKWIPWSLLLFQNLVWSHQATSPFSFQNLPYVFLSCCSSVGTSPWSFISWSPWFIHIELQM